MRTFAQQFLNNSDCIAPVPEPYDYTKVAPRVGGGKAEDVGEGGRVQMPPYASAWARARQLRTSTPGRDLHAREADAQQYTGARGLVSYQTGLCWVGC